MAAAPDAEIPTMRLTVRTLLAWIDEVLGSADHGELAAKVAASPVAPRLIERVRVVVETPSLSAPPPAARGLADDPNTAAEFLDNVLDGDRLEAFERVCIESDLHLADVAGSHRILAGIHRDPDSLEAFEPAAGRAALEAARTRDAAPLIDTSRGRTVRRPGTAVPTPGPRRRPPWFAWISAAVALLLLVGMGAVLLTLTRGKPPRPREVAAQDDAEPRQELAAASPTVDRQAIPAVPAAPPAVVPAEEVPDGKPEPPVENRGQAGATEPAAPPAAEPVRETAMIATPPSVPPPADAQPVPAPPAAVPAAADPRPPQAPPVDRTVPFGDALAIGGGAAAGALPAVSGSTPDGMGRETTDPAEAASSDASGVRLVQGAILARVAGGAAAWRAVQAGSPIGDGADRLELVAPAGVHPSLVVDGVAIWLHPGSRAFVSGSAGAAVTLELVHGRAVIEADGGGAWPAVIAGGLRGTLGMAVRQPAGIDVAFDGRPAAGRLDGVPPRAAVYAGSAARVWRQAAADGTGRPLIGIPDEVPLPAEHALRWDGLDPATARIEPCPPPSWLSETGPFDMPPVDRLRHRAAADLVRALAAAAPEAAVDTLRQRSAAGRPEDRAAAAATLASLGEPGSLVDLLWDEPPLGLNESQWSAVEMSTVPAILARGGPEADTLFAAVRDHAPEGAIVAALARGIGDDELAAGGDARLVEGLDAPSIVVRRYSIRRLREIVPSAVRQGGDDYHADRDAAGRLNAVNWWRSLAEKGGIRRQPAATPRAGRAGE